METSIEEKLTELCVDMKYVKEYIARNADIIIEISLLKSTVGTLTKIAWGIGSTTFGAVFLAILALII
jgi:hypothetical protein